MDYKEKKSVLKSVRLTESAAAFVEGYRGTGFNEKYLNIIYDFSEKLPELQKELERRQIYLDAKYDEMKKINKKIRALNVIQPKLQPLFVALVDLLPEDGNEN